MMTHIIKYKITSLLRKRIGLALLIILLQINLIFAQQRIDVGLFASAVPNTVEIKIKPNYNENGTRYLTNIQFTVRWAQSSGITSLSSDSPLMPYTITPQGQPYPHNGYFYQVFASAGGNSISWAANEEIVTQTFIYLGIPPFPYFEIAQDSYAKDSINGAYYIEINGNQTLTGSIYTPNPNLQYTWNGTQSTDWNTSLNWTPQGIPNSTSDAYIPASTSVHYSPIITDLTEVNKVTIYPIGKLTLAYNGKLTINNNLINNSDTGIIIKSTADGSGSLITLGAITGNGKEKVELYLAQDSSGGVRYHYISAPIANASTSAFQGYALHYLQESTNMWMSMSIDNSMNVLQGYGVYKPAMLNDICMFYGTLNTGMIGNNNNVTRSADSTGWNLIGNPYPSAIDWNASQGWTKTNVAKAIYFWNQATKSYSAFVTDIGINGATPIIPAMQSFLVRVDQGQSVGTIQMDNNVRVHSNQTFWKQNIQNILRLTASTQDFSDETIIRFDPIATSTFDSDWDAYKLISDSAIAQLYTLAGSDNLAINTLPAIVNDLIVPLNLKINHDGSYQITAGELGTFDAGIVVYLEDLLLNTTTDLMQTPTYNFTAVTADNPARFRVRFNYVIEGINPNNSLEKTEVFCFDNVIHIHTQEDADGKIEVYDLLGQRMFSSPLQNSTTNTFSINGMAQGYYLIKTYNKDEIIINKIFIK